jgi:hypothetical protein
VFSAVGGCKRIVAPDGSEVVPATKLQPNGTLVKALERISRSYVCRVLRRTLLAPASSNGSLTNRGRRGSPHS